MEKYYKTKEEMSKDFNELRSETLAELYYLKEQRHKESIKKITKWIAIIVIPIILLKLFVGTIVIAYIYPHNRMYSVTINNVNVTVEVIEGKTIHLIPLIADLRLYSHKMFYGDDFSSVVKVKQGGPYIINLKSYNCFTEMNNSKVQLGCDNGNDTINEPTNDTTYKLLISESKKNGVVLYDGTFINNITTYLQKTGYYRIEVIGKYGNVESRINFEIKVEP